MDAKQQKLAIKNRKSVAKAAAKAAAKDVKQRIKLAKTAAKETSSRFKAAAKALKSKEVQLAVEACAACAEPDFLRYGGGMLSLLKALQHKVRPMRQYCPIFG